MGHRTTFAGLAAPDSGDTTQVLNSDFIYRNPDLIDQFLRIGAVTHRHDGHLKLADPQGQVGLQAVPSAGALPGNTTFFVTYTITDPFGGETLAAPAAGVITGPNVATPSFGPSATVDYSAGIMQAGNHAYGLTYTDGEGGETPLGPVTWVYIDPGFASAQVDFAGLAAEIQPNGTAVDWRLWHSYEGEDWHLVAEASANVFVDAGFDPPDNPERPPAANTTGSNNAIGVTLPAASAEPALASATSIKVYLSEGGEDFISPALVQTLPIACAGATFTITTPTTSDGQPPAVSTSLPGAAQINPDTDILDWHWKRPVNTWSALPSGATGDVRLTIDTGHLWAVLGASGAANASGWTDLLLDPGDGSLNSVFASAGNASAFVTALEFAASGGATVELQSLGGGSAVIVIDAGTSGLGFVASAGDASGIVGPFLGFSASGGASVELVEVSGSAVVMIGASGLQGAQGPQGTIGATGPQGPAGAGMGAGGSGGVPLVSPLSYLEFASSGTVDVAIQTLGGGSARVLIGPSNTVPATTQASGYAFRSSDVGAVVESASASATVGYLVNPNAQTPLPLGAVIEVFQYGTGQVQVVASGGVALRSDGGKTKTAAQFATIGLRQRAIDEWVLSGDLA